jgi:SAM-dependent methyltransferase
MSAPALHPAAASWAALPAEAVRPAPPDYAHGYLALHPTLHAEDAPRKVREILSVLPPDAPPRTLLDYGCGAGAVLTGLVRALDAERGVGVDVSPAAVKLARSLCTDGRAAFLDCAELDAERFECVLLVDVLEHLPDPAATLRALAPLGDRAVVRLPLERTALNRVMAWLGMDPLPALEERFGHIHHFGLREALGLVRGAGLLPRRVRVFPLPMIRSRTLYHVQMLCWRALPERAYAWLFGGFVVCCAEGR